MALVPIENPLTNFMGVLLVVMLLELLNKFTEGVLCEGLLLVVELSHEGKQDEFVLGANLAG